MSSDRIIQSLILEIKTLKEQIANIEKEIEDIKQKQEKTDKTAKLAYYGYGLGD